MYSLKCLNISLSVPHTPWWSHVHHGCPTYILGVPRTSLGVPRTSFDVPRTSWVQFYVYVVLYVGHFLFCYFFNVGPCGEVHSMLHLVLALGGCTWDCTWDIYYWVQWGVRGTVGGTAFFGGVCCLYVGHFLICVGYKWWIDTSIVPHTTPMVPRTRTHVHFLFTPMVPRNIFKKVRHTLWGKVRRNKTRYLGGFGNTHQNNNTSLGYLPIAAYTEIAITTNLGIILFKTFTEVSWRKSKNTEV